LLTKYKILKKWNKGKMREKMNGKVLFDEDGWNRLLAEVPKVISLKKYS